MKISSNTSQEYFNIQPRTKRHTRHKISKVNPQPRFRTPISSLKQQQVRLHLFLPQGPVNHLQAQKYQPKIWNNHIDPVTHTYTSQRQNPINYDTHQENRTNYNNSIVTIQRLHFRKSSFQEYPNTTQSSNTFHYLNVQPSQGSVMYTFSKSVFRENILFDPDSTHIIISSRLMCARRSLHPRRIPHRLFWQDNGLREGVGEYLDEYSPYSGNKPFTPLLPIRTIFSPVLYLPARPGRMLYPPHPVNSICYPIGNHLGQS